MSWKIRTATPPLRPSVHIVQVIVKPDDRMVDGVVCEDNTSGYSRFKRIFLLPNNGSDFYFLVIEYSFLYCATWFSTLSGGGDFIVLFASFGEKEKMVTVFTVSAPSFVVSEVEPHFKAVFPPEPRSINVHGLLFAGHIQSDIDIVIVPGKVNLREWVSAPQVHEVGNQIERAPIV
jgi:hypothetical protein